MPNPLLDLNEIAETAASDPTTPDSKTREESRDLDKAQKAALLASLEQDIKERKKYAKKVFLLLSWWLVAMLILLLLQGFENFHIFCARIHFQLSENILIAAIGGTTINVIGIFLVVARYLFPRRDSSGD